MGIGLRQQNHMVYQEICLYSNLGEKQYYNQCDFQPAETDYYRYYEKSSSGKETKLQVKTSSGVVNPSNLIWTSSNKKVATVNSSGVVTFKRKPVVRGL